MRHRRRHAQQAGASSALPAGTTMLVVAPSVNGAPLPAVTVSGSGTNRCALSDASGVSIGGGVSAVAATAGAGAVAGGVADAGTTVGAGVVVTGVGRQAATAQLSAMAAWTKAVVGKRLVIRIGARRRPWLGA
jgi:hypothetical protein